MMYFKKITIFSTLILLCVLMGATGCQSQSQNQQPIEVISVSGVGPPNPGGPFVEITLKNVSEDPVTSLKATLELERDYEFGFVNVTPSNPLLLGESSNETLSLIGGGYGTETSYPLTITVTLQNGDTLTYTKQVQIH